MGVVARRVVLQNRRRAPARGRPLHQGGRTRLAADAGFWRAGGDVPRLQMAKAP